MSEDYYIKLNAIPGASDKYNGTPVGSVSPVSPPVETQNDVGFFEAAAGWSLPYRVGMWAASNPEKIDGIKTIATSVGAGRVFSQSKFDQALRAFSQNDDQRNKDPSFNPFTVWKDNEHNPEEINTIMGMDNWEQYYFYRESKNYERNVNETLKEAGLPGYGAALAGSLVSDPTTYMGFGVAAMLERGMAAKAAYALGGASAVGANEAIEQGIDHFDEKSLEGSALNIAAGAVIGGVLGTAVDAWRGRSKLAVEGKDFNASSMNYVEDAYNVGQRFESTVGAKAADLADPSNSEVLGFLANKGARGLRYLSPKLFGQSSKYPEVREIFDKFFGRNLKTLGDEMGEVRQISLAEESTTIENRARGMIETDQESMTKLARDGHHLDEQAQKQAILLASNGREQLKYVKPGMSKAAFEMAKKYRKYFSDFSDKLEKLNIDGYTTRNGYGAPLVFNPMKVAQNVPRVTELMLESFKRGQKVARAELQRLKTRQSARLAQGLETAEIDEEIEGLAKFADAEPEYLEWDAADATNRFAAGMGWEAFDGGQAIKYIPKRFRHRLFEFKDVIDFVETDPWKLMEGYAREISPFMASQKIFGDKTPYRAIEVVSKKLLEQASKADPKDADKIRKEIAKAERSLTTGWESATGERAKKLRRAVGDEAYNVLAASRSFTAMARLGNRVLASVSELNSILLHHHFKGYGGYMSTLAKFASDGSYREMSKQQSRIFGLGLKHSVQSWAYEDLAGVVDNAKYRGKTAQVAESFKTGARAFEVLNGGVFWDSLTRRALLVTQQSILRDSMKGLLSGKINKNTATDLSFLGINKDFAQKITKQMDDFGEEIDGVFVSNVDNWTDESAAEAWINALRRDNRRTSIVPGLGDVPHSFSVPGLANIFQFKSWAVTATQVYGLSALQRADSQHLMAIATLVGMSTMADMLDQFARGNEISTDPDELLWGGITRSGLLGVMPEFGGSWFMNKVADIESGNARLYDYASGSSILFGPASGLADDIAGAVKPVGQILSGDNVNTGAWAKDLLDLTPLPFVKPYIKNQIESGR